MFDLAIIWDWFGFAVRWIHVITAIAWIGSSFYFIALDLGLRRTPDLPEGAAGEEWQVHGGGFYHIQKYMVAPERMPDHLTWFKWESYATWLSGFALLAVIYYVSADLYLVDPQVLDISAGTAILISLASIGVGWVVYDLLCKSPLGADNTKLMILLYIVLVAMAWGYTQLFSGRAAFVHLGAFTATIMSANVFFIIIPNQEKVVASLKAGEAPDPALGAQAKQRSTHNNYLTLPILFLMGVTIRHYFNSKHARSGDPVWTWLATAILFVIIMWLSMTPKSFPEAKDEALSPTAQKFAASKMFSDVHETVAGRCAMCHAAEPAWEGMHWAPKGVLLETEAQIAERAREIYLHSGVTNAMPPANVSFMEPAERKLIQAWYREVVNQ